MGRVWAELTTTVNSTARWQCPKCGRLPGYKTKVAGVWQPAWAVAVSGKLLISGCFQTNGFPVDLTLDPGTGMTRPSAGAVRLIQGRRNHA
jgi:hypothetical protein